MSRHGTLRSDALPSTRTCTSKTLERPRNIWPHNRHVPNEASDGSEEVTKQDQDAIELDEEANKGPAGEDQRDACGEGEGAFPLLATREEGEGFCCTDDEGQADEEEDLASELGRGGCVDGEGTYVAHCQPVAHMLATVPRKTWDTQKHCCRRQRGADVHGAIKKHHDTAHQEQAAWISLLIPRCAFQVTACVPTS